MHHDTCGSRYNLFCLITINLHNHLNLFTMFFKQEEFKQLLERLSSASKEDLTKEFDELNDKLANYSQPVNKDFAKAIVDFLEKPILNSGFAQSAMAVAVYDKMSAYKKTVTINIAEIRALQTLLAASKPVDIFGMKVVNSLLLQMNHINLEVGKIEELSRQVGAFLAKKEQEEATGLTYAKDDAETAATLEKE